MSAQRDASGQVAVVIAVRDGETWLAEALQSALLEPETSEVVVVDDGSSDRSAAIALQTPRVRCVRQPPLGLPAAQNRGVAESGAPLIAFLDADDLFPPGRMRALQAASREAEAAFGMIEEFLSPDRPELRGRLRVDPTRRAARLPGTMLIRRSALARVGPFEPALNVGHFAEWRFRAGRAGLASVDVPQLALRRRVHGGNMSLRPENVRGLLPVLRAEIKRRRR